MARYNAPPVWTTQIPVNPAARRFFSCVHSRTKLDGNLSQDLPHLQHNNGKVLNRHGGQVRANSDPGQGTTFFFSLGDSRE
jgi:light-regulated signal transduction histidine kinase (bacteriophytochrome)